MQIWESWRWKQEGGEGGLGEKVVYPARPEVSQRQENGQFKVSFPNLPEDLKQKTGQYVTYASCFHFLVRQFLVLCNAYDRKATFFVGRQVGMCGRQSTRSLLAAESGVVVDSEFLVVIGMSYQNEFEVGYYLNRRSSVSYIQCYSNMYYIIEKAWIFNCTHFPPTTRALWQEGDIGTTWVVKWDSKKQHMPVTIKKDGT